jgi:hypothetical protein
MAKAIEKSVETTENKYSVRRWVKPKDRAASYAQERKAKKHAHGPKKDKDLTDYEAGIRSGYLQCQTDHAGLYKYKKALSEGKTKEEAKVISQTVQKKK